MKKYYKILYLIFFSFLITNVVIGQETGSIKGTVYNKTTKNGMPDVQVFIKDLGVGSTTNENGLFESVK